MQKKLLTLSLVLLVLLVGYSFYFVGTPGQQRAFYQDKEKLEDIKNISCVVENYFHEKETLPADMASVKNYYDHLMQLGNRNRAWSRCHCYVEKDINFIDLQAHEYEYSPEKAQTGTYKLCADFNASSEAYQKNYNIQESWMKGFKKGRHCFEIELKKCEKGN